MGGQVHGYQGQIDAARTPYRSHGPLDMVSLALAGVIAQAACRLPPYDMPIAGLDRSELAMLRDRIFPGLPLSFLPDRRAGTEETRCDEFDDLLALLLEHRSFDHDESRWLAYAIATACMGGNHLWQDMGLPDRRTLSWLMTHHFSTLSARNAGDMKWKKFFYRQLCERAGLFVCRSPSCGVCADYATCFGPEEGDELVAHGSPVAMPLPASV